MIYLTQILGSDLQRCLHHLLVCHLLSQLLLNLLRSLLDDELLHPLLSFSLVGIILLSVVYDLLKSSPLSVIALTLEAILLLRPLVVWFPSFLELKVLRSIVVLPVVLLLDFAGHFELSFVLFDVFDFKGILRRIVESVSKLHLVILGPVFVGLLE